LDIITDGEMRRESYSNRFATALEGVDIDNPGTALDRSGHPNPVPRVVGPIRRRSPVQVRDVEFLRTHTTKPIKITVPGPFTMSQQAGVLRPCTIGSDMLRLSTAGLLDIRFCQSSRLRGFVRSPSRQRKPSSIAPSWRNCPARPSCSVCLTYLI